MQCILRACSVPSAPSRRNHTYRFGAWVRLLWSCGTWSGGWWWSSLLGRPPLVPIPPSVRESLGRLDAAFGQRQGGSPLQGSSFFAPCLNACLKILVRFLSVGPGRCLWPRYGHSSRTLRTRPRFAAVETREGSVVVMRSSAASSRPHDNSPPLIGQLFLVPYLDD